MTNECENVLISIFFFFVFFDEIDDSFEYYDNWTTTESYAESDMPNSTIQDHRLTSSWSLASYNDSYNTTTLPEDMQFNDGHRLSIFCYR